MGGGRNHIGLLLMQWVDPLEFMSSWTLVCKAWHQLTKRPHFWKLMTLSLSRTSTHTGVAMYDRIVTELQQTATNMTAHEWKDTVRR